VTRILLTAVIAAVLTLSAAAQDPVEPKFFIERVEVRNAKRVSPDVVIYESRLREGNEYTEADLSDAAARLNRLPFLLSAEFSLDKGVERGQYVLVISIKETRPFFFVIDARPILSSNNNIVDLDYTDRLGGADNNAALGFRWFVGRRGMTHLGLITRDDNREYTRDYSALVAGYTQYDIFGTRAFATINLKRPIGGVSTAVVSPQVVAGIPVSPNQTVTVTYDETRFGSPDEVDAFGTMVEERDEERLVSARWSYNTTNDPFVPTTGTLFSVTPVVAWRDIADYNYYGVAGGPNVPPVVRVDAYSLHMNSRGVDLSAAHWYELNERDSVVGGVEGGWADVIVRSNNLRHLASYDSTYWVVHGGYSHSLWDRNRQKHGDSRLEATLRYTNRNGGERRQFFSYQQDVIQASASWVRRSSWGTFRLGAGYAW